MEKEGDRYRSPPNSKRERKRVPPPHTKMLERAESKCVLSSLSQCNISCASHTTVSVVPSSSRPPAFLGAVSGLPGYHANTQQWWWLLPHSAFDASVPAGFFWPKVQNHPEKHRVNEKNGIHSDKKKYLKR